MALFQYWNFNRFQNPFPVYRDNIMQLSRIGSKNTYHKSMKGLHQFGYIIFHSAPSKYLPAKITIIRLDIKTTEEAFRQLDLFSHVPNLTDAGINNDTQQVPNMGLYIKPNIFKNSVAHTPTTNEMKRRNESKNVSLPHVSNLRHVPSIEEVQSYFTDQGRNITEAQKFFYYNQSKKWMLTNKIPIYDWKALANKWMLNDKNTNPTEIASNLDTEIQYLYERFQEGEKINKLIQPEYADHLELIVTENLWQQAWQRRINQLSGSNEASEQKLWNPYMTGDAENDLIIKHQHNLISLAKRLAVSKHFQKLKSKGQTKTTKMNVKNYTSTVESSKSMAHIEELLVEIGATNINKQYKDKVCTGITFLYYDAHLQQTLAFHLKAQVEECFKILWKQVKRPQSNTKEQLQKQAVRTTWKILSDWTEIQCSMILLGQAKPLQMFLSFVYDIKSNETLFDKVCGGKLKLLA